ncbi:MAG: hypothetical protein QG650_871, partial [Patescibacteria group bacterium]|nr:hypothetical protein [Patescibacteria group bacterium]
AGGVKCWGNNTYGQLGDGTMTHRNSPVAVSGLSSGVSQVASNYSSCALTSAGGVKCWGVNWHGQLGDGTTTNRTTPVDVSGLSSGVTQISAGHYNTCATLSSGGVKCWGPNWFGQLGNGAANGGSYTPVNVSDITSGVTQISVGAHNACAVVSGSAKCWGYNVHGQIGDGTLTNRYVPTDVTGLSSGVTQISTGFYSACATVSGSAKCWGWNSNGQVGDGENFSYPTPQNVGQ